MCVSESKRLSKHRITTRIENASVSVCACACLLLDGSREFREVNRRRNRSQVRAPRDTNMQCWFCNGSVYWQTEASRCNPADSCVIRRSSYCPPYTFHLAAWTSPPHHRPIHMHRVQHGNVRDLPPVVVAGHRSSGDGGAAEICSKRGAQWGAQNVSGTTTGRRRRAAEQGHPVLMNHRLPASSRNIRELSFVC